MPYRKLFLKKRQCLRKKQAYVTFQGCCDFNRPMRSILGIPHNTCIFRSNLNAKFLAHNIFFVNYIKLLFEIASLLVCISPYAPYKSIHLCGKPECRVSCLNSHAPYCFPCSVFPSSASTSLSETSIFYLLWGYRKLYPKRCSQLCVRKYLWTGTV